MSAPLPEGLKSRAAQLLPRSWIGLLRVLFLALYTFLAAEDFSAALPMDGYRGPEPVGFLIVLGLSLLGALVMLSGAWLRWYLVTDLAFAGAALAVVIVGSRHGVYLWPTFVVLEDRAMFRGFVGRRWQLGSAVLTTLAAAIVGGAVSPAAQGNWAISGVFATAAFILSAILVRVFAELARSAEAIQRHRDDLLKEVVQVGEDERSHIANLLHDGPIQTLSAAAWNVARFSLLLDRGNAAEAQRLAGDVQEMLEEVIGELRHTMADLRPPVLDESGLEAAIRDHVRRLSPTLRCTVSARVATRPGATVETVLYRVAQEALTNIVKHAQARQVTVHISEADGQLLLEVADDGVGFDVERAESARDAWRHFGLATMRERIEGLRGTFRVTSTPGGGTRVWAQVPGSGALSGA